MLAKPPEKQNNLNNEVICQSRSLPSTTPSEEVPRSWAIGIYTGDSPLCLSPPIGIRNPVLTYNDISDARAIFVADPFIVIENDIWYMFFEVMNEQSDRGEIGLSVSKDGLRWEYRQIV